MPLDVPYYVVPLGHVVVVIAANALEIVYHDPLIDSGLGVSTEIFLRA